jgi:hypothetical protein
MAHNRESHLDRFMKFEELRWNFSSRARELSRGDVVGVSIPKSGRTWVRTEMAYVAEAMRELDPRFGYGGNIHS